MRENILLQKDYNKNKRNNANSTSCNNGSAINFNGSNNKFGI